MLEPTNGEKNKEMFETFHSCILNSNSNDHQLKLASRYTVRKTDLASNAIMMSFNMDFSSLFQKLITVLQIFMHQYTFCLYIYWKH